MPDGMQGTSQDGMREGSLVGNGMPGASVEAKRVVSVEQRDSWEVRELPYFHSRIQDHDQVVDIAQGLC